MKMTRFSLADHVSIRLNPVCTYQQPLQRTHGVRLTPFGTFSTKLTDILYDSLQDTMSVKGAAKGQVDGGGDSSGGTIGPFIVAAIDFGTTFSGYAFSFKHDYEKDPCQIATFAWPGARALMSLKTSTCVLFEPNQNFHSFGYEAEDHYGELAAEETGEHKKWYYFRRFKMQLFDKKELKKSFMINDETGKPMSAVKVFGYGIKYLKDHLFGRVKRTLPETRDDDIRYVLTVPAIWNEGAKLFMKEAAKVAAIDPSHLLIALEPEAASIYCKHIDLANFSGMAANFKPFASGSRYIILDAGGGTIDITVHEVQFDGHLKELYHANGGAWGGTFVDQCFEDFLREIVGDDIIDEFKTKFVGEYLDIFKEFEVKKREIKEDMRDKIQIKLDAQIPCIFEEKKHKAIKGAIKENAKYGKTGQADWMGDKLRVKKDICFKFFDRAMKSIGDHMETLMKRSECKGADTILMVGGFSESPLLQEYIRKRFTNKRVIVPEGAGMAVLKGAVIFGHDPSAISERKCRYTYGCEVYQAFNDKIHDPNRKVVNSEGQAKCKEVFSVHVKKDTVVKCGEYQVEKEYTPFMGDKSILTFDMYASESDNPKYITETGCFPLGKLSIQLPEGPTKDDKKIKLALKFGTTNLEATATAVKTGKSVTSAFELPS